jgi:hypothetical protein
MTAINFLTPCRDSGGRFSSILKVVLCAMAPPGITWEPCKGDLN